MNIAILNLEPTYTNIALKKISTYHESIGDMVDEYLPIADHTYDRIYCSSLFTFTDKSWLPIDGRWICGGTGFDIYSKLPKEIESLRPKINVGFCSRGCIRNCKFCIVRKKEGYIREYADIYDIWDGQSRGIVLFDNNILALPQHFERICRQLVKEKLKVDFNQGLDIRLLDKESASWLKKVSHKEHRFAFDSPKLAEIVVSKVAMLQTAGMKRSAWYVLIGCDTTLQEDLFRLNLLRDLKQNAYVMRYQKVDASMPDSLINASNEKIYTAISRWANNHAWFHAATFEQFILRDENRKYLPFYKTFIG